MDDRTAPNQYEKKLCKNGLVNPGETVWGTTDTAGVTWNRRDALCDRLAPLFARMQVSSLLFARPAEPYRTAIEFLARTAGGVVRPEDSETRMLLKDLPVIDSLSAAAAARALKDRKAAITQDGGILTCGSRSAAQAYVTFSSVCFAGFVKCFSDWLAAAKSGDFDADMEAAMARACAHLQPPPAFAKDLAAGPFEQKDQALAAIIEAGADLVDKRLVDSCFGNISYRIHQTIYISESGSFLDELENAITACPTDATRKDCPKASSELPAHGEIFRCTDHSAILHGHPVFAVIMSMDCDVSDCFHRGQCHRFCPRYREVDGIPVVAGEVGGGPYGLCTTVPKMIQEKNGAIVYGHGVFTGGETDFNAAMDRLVAIERRCRAAYFLNFDKEMGP